MNSFFNKLKPGGKKKNNSGSASSTVHIGEPFEVKHHIHVKWNEQSRQIEGLPSAWVKLLEVSNISNTEQSANPEAVVDVLNFYTQSMKDKNINKFIVTQDAIERNMQDEKSQWQSDKGYLNVDNESSDSSLKSSQEDLILKSQPSTNPSQECLTSPQYHDYVNIDSVITNSASKEDIPTIVVNRSENDNLKSHLKNITDSLDRVIDEAETILSSFDLKRKVKQIFSPLFFGRLESSPKKYFFFLGRKCFR